MGLFSDTKRYFYGIDANRAKMTFDEFCDEVVRYLGSEECKQYFQGNNCTLEVTSELSTKKLPDCQNAYELKTTLNPHGDMKFILFSKGENQGLAFNAYTLWTEIQLKKSDKKWLQGFFKTMLADLENTFNPDGGKKNQMFIGYEKG